LGGVFKEKKKKKKNLVIFKNFFAIFWKKKKKKTTSRHVEQALPRLSLVTARLGQSPFNAN